MRVRPNPLQNTTFSLTPSPLLSLSLNLWTFHFATFQPKNQHQLHVPQKDGRTNSSWAQFSHAFKLSL